MGFVGNTFQEHDRGQTLMPSVGGKCGIAMGTSAALDQH